MKEFVISEKEAGQRMDKYLFKVLNQAPKSFVYKMLRKKNIVLNDKKAAGQETLKASDHIKIYLSDETFEKFASDLSEKNGDFAGGKSEESPECFGTSKVHLDIVYEDADILILNKPAGVLSQKASPEDYSANEMVIDYLLESGQLTREELRTFHPSVCNRLDRNTSGLLIAGKTMRGLQRMSEQLKLRTMQKYYRCIVCGNLKEDAHLVGYLTKNHGTNKVTIQNRQTGDASRIETAYHPILQYPGFTLLEVHLITGRSHQIRAHLSSIGHPIAGDDKYGDRALNRRLNAEAGICGQLLHAYRMEFPDGQTVTAEEPQTFAQMAEWIERKTR